MQGKMLLLTVLICIAMLLTVCGCTVEKEIETVKESVIADETEITIPEGTQNLVGILARVETIFEDGNMLLCSQSTGFEGTYSVLTDAETLMTEITEGDMIEVLMIEVMSTEIPGICGVEKVGQEKQKHSVYLAKEITEIDEQAGSGHEDIMLTYAPKITLSDMLSSTANNTELQAGNCSWNYPENENMTSLVACGAHPLDEAFVERMAAWELPEYRNMDHVPISVSCQITPDWLTVREWETDAAGNYEAEEVSVTRYYYPVTMLKIEKDRIYELTASWLEESQRGYFGEGSYVLVTD